MLTNLNVHHNLVTSRVTEAGWGRTGIIDSKGSEAFSAAVNNRFSENAYLLETNRACFLWEGKELSAAEWRGAGQDVSGKFGKAPTRPTPGEPNPQNLINRIPQ